MRCTLESKRGDGGKMKNKTLKSRLLMKQSYMKVKLFMKNTWHLIACLMLLVACSDDKVEDETTITLPPET